MGRFKSGRKTQVSRTSIGNGPAMRIITVINGAIDYRPPAGAIIDVND